MKRLVTLRVRDLSIATSAAGESSQPALLLLHGWPQSRALYDGVLDPLSADFFVLAPDLPGVGGSRGAPPSGDKAILADLVLAAAETAGGRDIVVAGLDVGGMIPFAAAREPQSHRRDHRDQDSHSRSRAVARSPRRSTYLALRLSCHPGLAGNAGPRARTSLLRLLPQRPGQRSESDSRRGARGIRQRVRAPGGAQSGV